MTTRKAKATAKINGLSTVGLLVPCAEEAAKENEFAEMMGVVVGEEKSFAEEILAVAPAEGFVEIVRGLFDEGDEVFQVAMNGGDGFVPGVSGGRLGRAGPVGIGPFDGMVASGGRRGEVEDVALGDAKVFEKLPGGVGEVGRDGATEVGGEAFDGFVEGNVGLAAVKECEKLLPEFVLLCRSFDRRRRWHRFLSALWSSR
jgi:hypothetical protein